jgi:hypothetical protein
MCTTQKCQGGTQTRIGGVVGTQVFLALASPLTPPNPRLQLHIHQERPIRVISLGESRVTSLIAYLTNQPMDHDSVFRGVSLLPTCENLTVKNRKLTLPQGNRSRFVLRNLTTFLSSITLYIYLLKGNLYNMSNLTQLRKH